MIRAVQGPITSQGCTKKNRPEIPTDECQSSRCRVESVTVNSIKNAIVTLTLLAVGYGAYIVLQSPPSEEWQRQFNTAPTGQAGGPGSETIGHPELSVEFTRSEPMPEVTSAESSTVDREPQAAAPNQFFPGAPSHDDQPTPARHESQVNQGRDATLGPTAPALAGPMLGNPAAPGPALPRDDSTTANSDFEPVANGSKFAPDNFATSPSHANQLPLPTNDRPSEDSRPDESSPVLAEGNGTFEHDWNEVSELLTGGNLVQALAKLSDWYGEPTLSDKQQSRMLSVLDQLAGTLIYSRQHMLEPEYRVQPGETLADIAKKFEVPEAVLAKINGIALPYALTTNEELKVVRGPFRAEVSVSRRELTLFLGRYYAGRFPVEIGRDLPSDEAYYEVAEKSDGRSYFDRRLGVEVLKGEAHNRYGDHWIGLRGDQITAGHSVGIHSRPLSGAVDAETGCISLLPRDADDVGTILSIGSRIHVRR
jgi:hypothetical protein